jgi:hypothetical protein
VRKTAENEENEENEERQESVRALTRVTKSCAFVLFSILWYFNKKANVLVCAPSLGVEERQKKR